MEEEWKLIPHGDNNYMVSNHGNVKSICSGTWKLLKSDNLRSGYKSVGISGTSHKVHRLVAKAFIDNIDPLKNVVNHKDGNKLNNRADNLEWTTTKENTKHGYIIGKNKVTTRAVRQYDKDDNFIREFESLKQAKEITGIDDGGIAKVCKGTRPFAGGFRWKFAEENPNELHVDELDVSEYVDVIGFPNYKMSKDGNVYNIRYKKILKQQTNSDGYKVISIVNNNNKKSFLVHRLVAEHFIAKIEGKDKVNHKDGVRTNNHMNNLEWVTDSENRNHAIQMKKNK